MKTKHFLVTVCFFAAIIFFSSCVKLHKKKCQIYPLNTERLCTDLATELGDSMYWCDNVRLNRKDVKDSILDIVGGSLSFKITSNARNNRLSPDYYFFDFNLYNGKGDVFYKQSGFTIDNPFPSKFSCRTWIVDPNKPRPILGDGVNRFPIFEDQRDGVYIAKLQRESNNSTKRNLILSIYDSTVMGMYTFSFNTK
jgi:hypothetical protein